MPQLTKKHLTVIIPAYNEAASLGDTIRSLQLQTHQAQKIIVVDDCSTDGTGKVAESFGVTVVRPHKNTGSKAAAQNYALRQVSTEYTMAIDADTVLEQDAIEYLIKAMNDPEVAAACGFVLPRYVKTLWERGRYIEYLLAFTFYKPIQDYFGKPLISSGCFSIYRTEVLRSVGGWPVRTMAEDMDLTWTFYQKNYRVRFIPGAVCYPIEPYNYKFMSKQLTRWSHGFVQNVRLHWKGILSVQYLNSIVTITLWDGVIASIMYLFIFPILSIFISPLFLVVYIIDIPAVFVPAALMGWKRKELLKVIASLPSFFVLRVFNSIFLLKALWREWIVKKPLLVYEKGH